MSLMKKTAVVSVLLAAALVICGCKNNSKPNTPITSTNPQAVQQNGQENVQAKPEEDSEHMHDHQEDVEALAQAALEKMSIVPEYPEGYPTLEDVIAQYEMANIAIGWIVRTESVVTYPEDNFWIDGIQYQRVRPDCYLGSHVLLGEQDEDVEHEKLIYNIETLRAYFATLIHPDEADGFIADIENDFTVPRFVERDGKLYAISIAFPASGYRDEDEYELIPDGNGGYTFSVKYATLDENGDIYKEFTENFGYEKVDGRWVFTDFRVIKQH